MANAIAMIGSKLASGLEAGLSTPSGTGKLADAAKMLNMPAVAGLGPASSAESAGSFQSVLADAVGRVEGFQAESQATMSQFLAGGDVDLHQVAISAQKAETSFELFAEVRNKVVSAYQEIMRTQI